MRNILMKVGRFAYLLPYLILPFVCMIAFNEDLPEAFLLTFFLPFGIESFAIILFPVSWLVSLACFILCGKQSRKNKSRKEKIQNIVCAIITGVWATLHIGIIIIFLLNLRVVY